MRGITADRDLWLNADKSAVVEAGSDARFLLARKGRLVTEADAERYGLNEEPEPKPKPKPKKKTPATKPKQTTQTRKAKT